MCLRDLAHTCCDYGTCVVRSRLFFYFQNRRGRSKSWIGFDGCEDRLPPRNSENRFFPPRNSENLFLPPRNSENLFRLPPRNSENRLSVRIGKESKSAESLLSAETETKYLQHQLVEGRSDCKYECWYVGDIKFYRIPTHQLFKYSVTQKK